MVCIYALAYICVTKAKEMTTKQITERAKEMVALQLSSGNKVSLKWAKDVITSSIAASEKREKISIVRKNIESFLSNEGFDFSFSSVSDTNGLSIYYIVNENGSELKFRFSDHSVTNTQRVLKERHFDIKKFF